MKTCRSTRLTIRRATPKRRRRRRHFAQRNPWPDHKPMNLLKGATWYGNELAAPLAAPFKVTRRVCARVPVVPLWAHMPNKRAGESTSAKSLACTCRSFAFLLEIEPFFRITAHDSLLLHFIMVGRWLLCPTPPPFQPIKLSFTGWQVCVCVLACVRLQVTWAQLHFGLAYTHSCTNKSRLGRLIWLRRSNSSNSVMSFPRHLPEGEARGKKQLSALTTFVDFEVRNRVLCSKILLRCPWQYLGMFGKFAGNFSLQASRPGNGTNTNPSWREGGGGWRGR